MANITKKHIGKELELRKPNQPLGQDVLDIYGIIEDVDDNVIYVRRTIGNKLMPFDKANQKDVFDKWFKIKK